MLKSKASTTCETDLISPLSDGISHLKHLRLSKMLKWKWRVTEDTDHLNLQGLLARDFNISTQKDCFLPLKQEQRFDRCDGHGGT